MINYSQYQINKEYNQFLSELVFWNHLNNKVKAGIEQGYNSAKNYEKMKEYEDKVLALLSEIEKLDRSKIRSFFPLVDDVVLIQVFKETVS
jgi:replication-associated recombination protein RarA